MPHQFPFSPAEALILLDPARWHGREGVKATLLALLARGVLRLEPGRGWFSRKKATLHVAAGLSPLASPQERAVAALVRDAGGGGAMAAVVREARSRFGSDLNRFDRDLVRPGLIHRGLVVEGRARMLFVFSRRRDTLTAAGEQARRQVEEVLRQVRAIPGMIDRDPAAAAAVALGAGAAIFLVPELKAYYAQLSSAMRNRGSGDGGGDTGSDDTDVPGGEHHGHDFGDLDVAGFDLAGLDLGGFDVGAFDSFDSAMSSFDASFDSAADSGGGDGGSGDGGSSGC